MNTNFSEEFNHSINDTIEQKFIINLQWSMLFFCFNYIATQINQENDTKKLDFQNRFIKTWKKFVYKNIVGSDLKKINEILTTPKNIFNSALQNEDEITESTEMYQEKFNYLLNKIENFFIETIKSSNIKEDE